MENPIVVKWHLHTESAPWIKWLQFSTMVAVLFNDRFKMYVWYFVCMLSCLCGIFFQFEICLQNCHSKCLDDNNSCSSTLIQSSSSWDLMWYCTTITNMIYDSEFELIIYPYRLPLQASCEVSVESILKKNDCGTMGAHCILFTTWQTNLTSFILVINKVPIY